MKHRASFLAVFCLFVFSSSAAGNQLKSTFEQATLAYSEGRYQEAIDLYQETLKIKPDFAPSYNYLGLCYQAMGKDRQETEALFQRTVEIDPKYALAYDSLLKIAYDHADFDSAETYGLKALEIDPTLYGIRLKLAWIYLLGRSNPTSAIAHFEKVLAVSQSSSALFGLGLAYFMKDRRVDVLDIITRLHQAQADNFAGHLEDMMRRGYYVPPEVNGVPLIFPTKKEEQKIEDDSKYFDDLGEDIQNMPVRLKGINLPLTDSQGNPIQKDVPIDPQQRIKQLQQNSLPEGQSY